MDLLLKIMCKVLPFAGLYFLFLPYLIVASKPEPYAPTPAAYT
jgi:hypothetical protein